MSSVREMIARHAMLRAGDRVGVAVSGGADSVALALILKRLQTELGVTLFIVHFNHQLRGADSDGDEKFVKKFAAMQELEFVAGRGDVAARARENGWNLEDAARRLRYAFFAKIVTGLRADKIAVAHTANDQAETVIAQIVRGTGPTGLAAIYPVSDHIIRPLLGARRESLREFLRSEKQDWREDATNEDESRLRARIRRRLLPAIEKDFQPHIVEHLGRLADLSRKDEAAWRLLIEDRFQSLTARSADSLKISIATLLDPMAFESEPQNSRKSAHRGGENPSAALTTRLIRRIFEELKGSAAGFTSGHVEDVLRMVRESSSGRAIHLPSGIIVEKSFGDLIFTRQTAISVAASAKPRAAMAVKFAHNLQLSQSNTTEVAIPEIGHRLLLKVIDWPAATRETSIQAIDWERLRAPLLVRNWQPGDAFRPHGRLREHKLKELLSVKRIPVRERASWPVLTSAGFVVWTRGFPVAEKFAAGANTRRGVLVVEEMI
jgi:tRNA(Ile)-lysidine synthase